VFHHLADDPVLAPARDEDGDAPLRELPEPGAGGGRGSGGAVIQEADEHDQVVETTEQNPHGERPHQERGGVIERRKQGGDGFAHQVK